MPTLRLTAARDRKVTPHAEYDLKNRRWWTYEPNAFGLPSRVTCPGKTRFCDGCYATAAEANPLVRRGLWRNLRVLEGAKTVSEKEALLVEMLGRWERRADRAGYTGLQRMFRFHWSGDFYSAEYAEAVRRAIDRGFEIPVFLYTRSFTDDLNVIPILHGARGTEVYLSVDRWNVGAARRVLARYPDVRVGWSEETREDGVALAEMHGSDAVPCPENAGRLKLVVAQPDGSGVGACQVCGICPSGRRDVVFWIDKRR